MHIAGLPEEPVFEMMMLEIADCVRHVRFARQERLLPQHRLAALDA
jgi:hypothetical protein